jgi:hypothetical protein
MLRSMLAFAVLALPAAAIAQERVEGSPPQRIRNVQLLPGENCPKAVGDEIVVCAAVKDQYRIPSAVREQSDPAGNQSWAARANAAMDDNRKVLPGSCSAVGSNGATGCAQKAAEEWAAEKRAAANASRPR